MTELLFIPKETPLASFFLQEYEIRILEQIYNYCCEQNYIKENVCVLCADGIMLENKLIADADIPTELHKVVLETTGFDLTFTKKELDNGWSDEFLDEHKINISAFRFVQQKTICTTAKCAGSIRQLYIQHWMVFVKA